MACCLSQQTHSRQAAASSSRSFAKDSHTQTDKMTNNRGPVMETTPNRLLCILVGFTFGHLLIGATPAAAQDDCRLTFDAMSKVFDTPSHSYTRMNLGSTTQTVESINTAGTSYTKVGSKWSPGLIPLQEMKELDQKNRRDNRVTCHYLRDEPVNGEIAAVYSVHEETPKKGKTDSQVWISKAKGLLLRSEIDLGDKMHISTRIEYGNIKPPI
jgi:hypothetical protein